jgi:hypothetical protein
MAAAENLPTVVSLDQMVADHIAAADRTQQVREEQEAEAREIEGELKITALRRALFDELGPAFYAACDFRFEYRSEDARYKDYPYRAWAITSLDGTLYDIAEAHNGADRWRVLIRYETTFYAAAGQLAHQLITNMASKRRYLRRIEEEQAATRERMAKAKANKKPPTLANIADAIRCGERPASIELIGRHGNTYVLSPVHIVWTSKGDRLIALETTHGPKPLIVPRSRIISIEPATEHEPTACVFACADCGDGTWAGMLDDTQCPNCGQTSATYTVASGIPVKTEQDPPIGDDEAPF